MSEPETLAADVVIAGAGLAGMVTALELLEGGFTVLLVDKDTRERVGGLARESFGGIHLIGTPHQRRLGIEDSPELGWEDWQRVARYDEDDDWPRAWGRFYCEHSREFIYEFLHRRKVRFLPFVNWPERGFPEPHNSVPRWHIAWGTGYEIVRRLRDALASHPRRGRLTTLFDTEVTALDMTGGRVTGIRGRRMDGTGDVAIRASHVVIASGGMCGGDLSKVRANWYTPWGEPPPVLLNGAHQYGDGLLQDRAGELGASVTHLDRQWHYAAGVHHVAARRVADGLSLVPPRSALWLNAKGERIMSPGPMLAYSDTRRLVAVVLGQPGQYSWQVMNWTIAIRELAVSGCDYMTAFRYKKPLAFAANLLFGNRDLVRRLIRDCPDDIVVADTLDDLMAGMDRRSMSGLTIDRAVMERTIREWDAMIDGGPRAGRDEQIQWIARAREYRGDRVRTCNFQKILARSARPLIAIREFILARKSLGGLQTDLSCRVLRAKDGEPIPGLYAVGEAAGFGGGGMHGQGSLEGTFLGGCVLSGRLAGQAIPRV